MKKLFQRVSLFFISTYFLSQRVFAQMLYGPPPDMQKLYGPPNFQQDYGVVSIATATGGDISSYTLQKILLLIVLPIIVVVAIVTGIVIYIKRKKRKSLTDVNPQDKITPQS
jgi:uncharacterized protein YneF (UPF0154 family)